MVDPRTSASKTNGAAGSSQVDAERIRDICTHSVYLLGGTYVAAAQVLVRFDDLGPMPRINVGTAIIGVTGLSAGGFSSGTIEEAQATKAMIDTSQRTILVSDHRKFSVVAFARIAELRQAA